MMASSVYETEISLASNKLMLNGKIIVHIIRGQNKITLTCVENFAFAQWKNDCKKIKIYERR